MFNDYEITMDSFGSECPTNWEEIADFLNDIIETYVDELTTTDEDGVESTDWRELRDKTEQLWEDYWNGKIDGAPIAEG